MGGLSIPSGGGGGQPARSESPARGHGQATDASRVTRTLHPQQAQEGMGGRRGCGPRNRRSFASRTVSGCKVGGSGSTTPGPLTRAPSTGGCRGTTPPVAFLPREDGTATSHIPEMDALLQRVWGPIDRKYADQPEPDVDRFMEAYGHHLRCVPMVSAPLTGERLSQRARPMKPSALGLDGWALQDLRALPPDLMDWLAALLGVVERTGRWPGALTRGYAALVPKEGPPGALHTCILTVSSIVYRLWAGARLQEAMASQERWAHPLAFGFRPARSAANGSHDPAAPLVRSKGGLAYWCWRKESSGEISHRCRV